MTALDLSPFVFWGSFLVGALVWAGISYALNKMFLSSSRLASAHRSAAYSSSSTPVGKGRRDKQVSMEQRVVEERLARRRREGMDTDIANPPRHPPAHPA